MKRVFGFPMEKKAELIAILEADPYAETSFARMGYKLKEGGQVGADPKMLYLYISADDKLLKAVEAKLKPLEAPITKEMEKKVIDEIDKEEDNA
ncbi:MAG: hypothetical protein QXH30_02620, partial [Candidatus Bilamarchaeaceae archaeon]